MSQFDPEARPNVLPEMSPDMMKSVNVMMRAAVGAIGIFLILSGFLMAYSVFNLVKQMVLDPETVPGQLERWARAMQIEPQEKAPSEMEEEAVSTPDSVAEGESAASTDNNAEAAGSGAPSIAQAAAPPENQANAEGESVPKPIRRHAREGAGRRIAQPGADEFDPDKLIQFLYEGMIEGKFGPAIGAALLFCFTVLLVRIPLALIATGARVLLSVSQSPKGT